MTVDVDLCDFLRQALDHEQQAAPIYMGLLALTEARDTTPDREFARMLVTVMAVDNQAHVQALARLLGQYCPS